MNQNEFLTKLLQKNKDAIIVSSLGTISYDIAEIDHPNKVIIKGAMGAAVPCGFGIALNTDKEVIVVVGDGSVLMKLGAMATISAHKLPNLKIIIINNNCYRSCGGQPTNFKYIRDFLPYQAEVHRYDS